jgi:hypothetical protein
MCISLASVSGTTFLIDRLIESVSIDPGRRVCTIWVDVFINNTTAEDQHAFVLHRGNLQAANVTRESWSMAVMDSDETLLTRRLESLHRDHNSILRTRDGVVTLVGRDYTLWDPASPGLLRITHQKTGNDVPFSMWRLGPFRAGSRCVVRLRLTMETSTYTTQIGEDGEFFAYGNAILLDLIDRTDLPHYYGTDAEEYDQCRKLFQVPIVPTIYEWLLISPEGSSYRWETTPLSFNLSPQLITDDYRETTHWYVIDNSRTLTWCITGHRPLDFALKVHSHGVAVIKIRA